MKTIIIFNFHANSVPEKPGRKQVIKGVVGNSATEYPLPNFDPKFLVKLGNRYSVAEFPV